MAVHDSSVTIDFGNGGQIYVPQGTFLLVDPAGIYKVVKRKKVK